MILNVEAVEGGSSAELLRRLKADGCKVDVFEVDKSGADIQSFTILTTIRIPRSLDQEEYIESLMEIIGILSIDSM